MARPDSYREQDGCWNCQHVHETDHYDGASDFFCVSDGILQPSLNLDEYVGDKRKLQTLSGRQKVYDNLLKTWHRWADPRQVKEYGICGQWKKREASDEPPNGE